MTAGLDEEPFPVLFPKSSAASADTNTKKTSSRGRKPARGTRDGVGGTRGGKSAPSSSAYTRKRGATMKLEDNDIDDDEDGYMLEG